MLLSASARFERGTIGRAEDPRWTISMEAGARRLLISLDGDPAEWESQRIKANIEGPGGGDRGSLSFRSLQPLLQRCLLPILQQ